MREQFLRIIELAAICEPANFSQRYLISLKMAAGEFSAEVIDTKEGHKRVFSAKCFVHPFDDDHNSQLPNTLNLILDALEKYQDVNLEKAA
ncbi:hypothetical protein [Catenovulum sediminis]|uniref:Uncharacterized protein n=1 Tax=Catenovulum sediminis TaxID=1740262 RepID=A0ABV1RHB4_9ALTE